MNKIEINIDKIAKNALKKTGERISAKAKQYVPIDTGNLLSTIRYRVDDDELTISCGGQGYSKQVDYAEVVEDRTQFFSKAFDEECSIDISAEEMT